MSRVLIVTNDFPPRAGGIQAFVHGLAVRLASPGSGVDDIVVYAPRWPGSADFDVAQPFRVVRHPTSLMMPTPFVARRAAALVREHHCDAVWFGAAAPLALLAPGLRRAGARRIVATTHGHEAGWAQLPGARLLLRRLAGGVDVLTYLGDYTRDRLRRAVGPQPTLAQLAPGVDPAFFRPDAGGDSARDRHGLAGRRVVVCVSRLVRRKGQDVLVRALPAVVGVVPDAALLLVGGGPDRARLERLARAAGVAGAVRFTGSVGWEELPAYYAAGDVFAMPCRTRRGGLDVEGLGIVYLEASASGLPVVAGDSGGAPDAVLPEQTGVVVDGRDVTAVARALIRLLDDRAAAQRMGAVGRAWVEREWSWDTAAAKLAAMLSG